MSTSTGRGQSVPPYPYEHSGPVMVCGSAECLQDDLAAARDIYPDAPAIAVNGAARIVKAFALFTQHPRNMELWIAQQREAFGDDFTTHAAGIAHLKTKLFVVPPMPWVQYRWDGVATGGTSAWGARRMARLMGFDTVVLCGVPLVAGDYFYGRGSKSNRSGEAMQHYREMIMNDTGMHDGVYGMSGWSREFFGCPSQ